MDIIQIVGIALLAAMLILIVKEQSGLFAFLLALFTGLVIFLLLVDKIAEVIAVLERLASRSHVNMVFFQTILKIIGIAYIAEFGAQALRDAGAESVASKVELAGKVLILVLAIPIISVIVETVLKLMPA